MIENNVCAIIVTYNRKMLLLECIQAVLNQSYPVEKIILIDNASTDGTGVELKKQGLLNEQKIDYRLMSKNLGGAGGFYEGIKLARNMEYKWIWLMDDDTIPLKNCLEKLIAANEVIENSNKNNVDKQNPPAYFASAVYGPKGEFMNLPEINYKQSTNGYAYWYKYLENSMVGIKSATFVSLLINKKAILKCGLPCKEYFIWGDDSEYTLRLSKYFGDGFFVGDSIAIHKRIGAKLLLIDNEENIERIAMFHYLYRNQEINRRYYDGQKRRIYHYILIVIKNLKYIKQKNGVQKYKAILRGYFESVVQYKKFKDYIDQQLLK